MSTGATGTMVMARRQALRPKRLTRAARAAREAPTRTRTPNLVNTTAHKATTE